MKKHRPRQRTNLINEKLILQNRGAYSYIVYQHNINGGTTPIKG